MPRCVYFTCVSRSESITLYNLGLRVCGRIRISHHSPFSLSSHTHGGAPYTCCLRGTGRKWSFGVPSTPAFICACHFPPLSRLVLINVWYFHSLPIGLFAFPFMALSGVLQQKFDAKHILLGGLVLIVAGTVFFPFADSTSRYWSIAFPGFMLGTAGTTVVFATTK